VTQFVDECSICVRGGDGGAGAVSFRREAHVPRGGPDGGDGGRGGDVWLVADRNVASLLAFRDHPHRRAGNGAHGQGKLRHGAAGRDLLVPVPPGTVVKTRDGEVLADLVNHGDRFLAAAGGRGGRGNARFLSNHRRAPTFAEQGEHGEERWLRLELKLMADVALVGFPNAGKSTLISRISAARPKVADYPFTTLEPHLGVVRVGDCEFVVADIPGLIEGASEGRGLGLRFLRHIERSRVLVVMCDLAPADGRPPAEQERILLTELRRYRAELCDRPRLVVGSKADVALPAFAGFEGLRISAVTGEGIAELLGRLARMVTEARAAEPAVPREPVVLRPAPEGFSVERAPDGAFVVSGRAAERAVAVNDLTNPEALAYVQGRLRRMGLDRALARAGARPGDTVHVGGLTFEYQPDATGS
jgi:GTP-binding protein